MRHVRHPNRLRVTFRLFLPGLSVWFPFAGDPDTAWGAPLFEDVAAEFAFVVDVETFPGVTGDANTSGDDARCCGDMIAGYREVKQTERLFKGVFKLPWNEIETAVTVQQKTLL